MNRETLDLANKLKEKIDELKLTLDSMDDEKFKFEILLTEENYGTELIINKTITEDLLKDVRTAIYSGVLIEYKSLLSDFSKL